MVESQRHREKLDQTEKKLPGANNLAYFAGVLVTKKKVLQQ